MKLEDFTFTDLGYFSFKDDKFEISIELLLGGKFYTAIYDLRNGFPDLLKPKIRTSSIEEALKEASKLMEELK